MKKLIFIGVMGLFVLGSCNSIILVMKGMTTRPSHTIMMNTKDMTTKRKVMTTKPKEPTIHTKVNAAEDTITAKLPPANPPASTAMKSSSRKRKLTLPV